MPCRFLDPALPASVLVPALLSYGQLARLSRENYPVLAQVLLPKPLLLACSSHLAAIYSKYWPETAVTHCHICICAAAQKARLVSRAAHVKPSGGVAFTP